MTKTLQLNGSKVTLTGNLLTGDTYRIKNYIKREYDGKWDADHKGWIVNLEKFAYALEHCYIYPETTTPATTKTTGTAATNGWCDKCHSYCWGDCTA